MKKQINDVRNEVNEMEEEIGKVKDDMTLLEKVIDSNNKKSNTAIKILFVLNIIAYCIIAYFAYVYTTTTEMETTTTEQEGVYNFVDSEGNVISSDLSLEEMQELIDINGEN